jgi:hypothetical protein
MLFVPCIPAIDAPWLVHAKTGTAPGAGPTGSFVGYERFHPSGSDAFQVGEDAYCVPGPVACVKMQQGCARIVGTRITKLTSPGCEFSTGFDFTGDAAFRLVGIISPAAGAGLAVTNVGATKAAIYAARGNDIWIRRLYLHEFTR